MKWFKFNDFISTDNSIVIKEMPTNTLPLKDIESIKVLGSNNTLHIDKNTYSTYEMNVVCILMDITKINEIKNKLRGLGKLILSDDENIEYTVKISNQIDFSKYLTYLKEFEIQFEVDPIKYNVEETTINLTESDTITLSGNIETEPVLKISGSGTIRINNIEIIVNNDSELDIILECKLLTAYFENGVNANNKVYYNKKPVLKPGNNIIEFDNTITSLTLKYKEGWL